MNMKDNNIIIFSDGSARGNPGPGGWGAIFLVGDKVAELGGREAHTTNNRMELTAAIKALSLIKKDEVDIILNTDSAYVVNGITKWVYGWQKNNWKTSEKEPVVNKDLWEELIKVSSGNPSQIKSQFDGARKIKWNQIGGHIGVPGNERCDEIATSFADLSACDAQAGGVKIKLFKGKISDYKYDLSDTKGSGIKKKAKKQNKMSAYSYLSLVHGVLKIDKTWAECEKRVKGVKGDVKFKKAVSAEDEKQILKEWLNNK